MRYILLGTSYSDPNYKSRKTLRYHVAAFDGLKLRGTAVVSQLGAVQGLARGTSANQFLIRAGYRVKRILGVPLLVKRDRTGG